MPRRASWVLPVLLVPGVLVGAFGFLAGGYFPGPTALAVVGLGLVLVLRLTLAERPLAGVSPAFVVAGALLALLTAWTLVSSAWSDAPARALIEYDRTLLYLLAFVVLGVLGRSAQRMRWLVRGVWLAMLVVCLCAFVTRALPDVWPTPPAAVGNDRLNFPLTYWNALGLVAALGFVLGFSLSGDGRERAAVRVLGAASLPVLAATLFFTFSRGSMAAGAAGLVAAVILARSPAFLSAAVSALPAAFAVKASYAADLLATDRPTTDAAVAQGHDLAVVVALCVLVAAALRAALLAWDRYAARLRVPEALGRPAVQLAVAAVVAGVVAAGAVAAGAPETVSRQYERFVEGDQIEDTSDQRGRLTDAGNNGRLDQWRVALRESRSERLHGLGAGTYALMWEQGRPKRYKLEDAHSLYLEMLAELGIVGLALLIGFLLLVLTGLLWRSRGPDRGVYAALFGAGLAWSLHAGIDWDWEMPATAVWLFAAGGLALAAPERPDPPARGDLPRLGRVVAALGVLVVLVTPARMYLSEEPRLDGARAFQRGDCSQAVDRSLDSIAMLGSRPEPFLVLGLCDVRLGFPELAVRAIDNAVERDPGNWEFHYASALVRGAARQDPRPPARRALQLNPRSLLAREAVRRFATDDPEKWRRRALAARLPRDD